MQPAFARCARCSQVSRNWTTYLVAESQHRRTVGSHTFTNDTKRYSSSKSAGTLPKSTGTPSKSTGTSSNSTSTDHERFHALRQQSVLNQARSDGSPKPEPKPKPIVAPEYIRLNTPTVQDARFDFDQPNPRKKARAPIPQMEAKIFGKDTAEGLSEVLQNNKLGTDPQALFGILAGWLLRHEARNMGYGVAPDGFVRVSDILRFPPFNLYSVAELAWLVETDEKDRFEVARLPDLIEGVMQDVWWIRARHMHSIPGVSAGNKRVLRPEKLQLVEYRTLLKNWDYIRANGIPEDSSHLIRLYNPSGKHLFLECIPFQEKVLSITIDSQKAMHLGVMFYHTPDVELYAAGTRDKGVIPLEACRSAVILDISKEALK